MHWDEAQSAAARGLWAAVMSYQAGRTRFGTWLSTKVLSALLDEAREIDYLPRLMRSRAREGAAHPRVRAFSQIEAEDAGRATARADEGAPAPSLGAETEEFWAEALRQFPPRHAEALGLVFREGLSQVEAGARMVLSESRVSQLVAQARDWGRARGPAGLTALLPDGPRGRGR